MRILGAGMAVYLAELLAYALYDAGYGGDLPLRMVLLALGLVLLGRLVVRRRVERCWEVLGFAAIGAAFLLRLILSAYALGLSAAVLLDAGLWMYLVYLYAFYIFAPRAALLYASTALVASAAALLPLAVGSWGAAPGALWALLQFEAGGVVGIVLAHGLSSWKVALGSAQRRAEDAQRDALTDVLTRLPNRRALDFALSREIAGARRGRSPFALLLFDIDHFKRLNDDLGHRAGDTALAGLAGLLQGALREEDVVGRWGGDEFVALAPGTDGGAAMALAERVRLAVAGYAWTSGGLTVSVGVALYHPGDGAETMLARADRGLYRSKDGGRNCCTLEAE